MSLTEFLAEKKKAGISLVVTTRTVINKDTNTIEAVIFNDGPESLDINMSNGMVIYFTGNRTKIGNPGLNQMWQNQSAFYQSSLNGNIFPAFYNKSNIIMGEYKVDTIYKCIAPNGCSYFSIKLLRKTRNKTLL
jgi:hypothetical protein